jgi:hypothetical protein
LELIRSVSPNTISSFRISGRLNIPRQKVNAILYKSNMTQRHVKSPLNNTDPHITWSIGVDHQKHLPTRAKKSDVDV